MKIVDSLHLMIKHRKYNVEKKSLDVSKIDIDKHDKIAEEEEIVKNKIHVFLLKYKLEQVTVVGQNIPFDIAFLKAYYGEQEYPFHYHYIDTKQIWHFLKLCHKIPPALYNHLQDMAMHFDIDYSKAHDALEDCKITAQVFFKLIKKIR